MDLFERPFLYPFLSMFPIADGVFSDNEDEVEDEPPPPPPTPTPRKKDVVIRSVAQSFQDELSYLKYKSNENRLAEELQAQKENILKHFSQAEAYFSNLKNGSDEATIYFVKSRLRAARYEGSDERLDDDVIAFLRKNHQSMLRILCGVISEDSSKAANRLTSKEKNLYEVLLKQIYEEFHSDLFAKTQEQYLSAIRKETAVLFKNIRADYEDPEIYSDDEVDDDGMIGLENALQEVLDLNRESQDPATYELLAENLTLDFLKLTLSRREKEKEICPSPPRCQSPPPQSSTDASFAKRFLDIQVRPKEEPPNENEASSEDSSVVEIFPEPDVSDFDQSTSDTETLSSGTEEPSSSSQTSTSDIECVEKRVPIKKGTIYERPPTIKSCFRIPRRRAPKKRVNFSDNPLTEVLLYDRSVGYGTTPEELWQSYLHDAGHSLVMNIAPEDYFHSFVLDRSTRGPTPGSAYRYPRKPEKLTEEQKISLTTWILTGAYHRRGMLYPKIDEPSDDTIRIPIKPGAIKRHVKLTEKLCIDTMKENVRVMSSFSADWEGVIVKDRMPVNGTLIISDSMMEAVCKKTLTNTGFIMFPPPLGIKDLTALFKESNDELFYVHDIVIAWGIDAIIETHNYDSKAGAERILEILFHLNRIYQKVLKRPKSTRPKVTLITIPDHENCSFDLRPYNAAIRNIATKTCNKWLFKLQLCDWSEQLQKHPFDGDIDDDWCRVEYRFDLLFHMLDQYAGVIRRRDFLDTEHEKFNYLPFGDELLRVQ